MSAPLVIASNRLPVTVELEDGKLRTQPSSGGLVAALRGPSSTSGSAGPARPCRPSSRPRSTTRLEAEGCEPVFLSDPEQEAFYGQICNDTLWPLFHYFVERLQFTDEAWQSYVEVNERFADAIARSSAASAPASGSTTSTSRSCPAALRRRRPDLAIGFFLHIPFPSSEIYRVLPTRAELLRGILGADYIGFHTGDYARHFRSSCLRVLGLESEPDSLEHDGRTVGFGADPIGIDVASFRETLRSPETARIEAELAERYEGKQLVLGVERLDYTKGIPQKLDAFERILEQDPERARDDHDAPGARAVAAPEPGLPGQARRDRDAHRPRERPLRPARPRARSSTSTGASRTRSSRRSTGAPT